MSGETLDSDKAAIKKVLPHVWVFIKNKSIAKTRYRMKKENRDASGIKDAKLDNCPEDLYPPEVVTFRKIQY